jgi:hypothetical protein
MIQFGIIGFLILALIFVVLSNKGTQRELKQIKRAHKLLQTQNKYSLGIVMAMSTQLQHVFQTKLTALNNHGLIKRQDYDIAHFILENFQYIIVQCCQHNETVEVAVRKALKGQTLTIDFVSQFIARQPSEVRVPWCKNTVDGFIAACRNMVADKVKTTIEVEDTEPTIGS